jgi:pantoate kinase
MRREATRLERANAEAVVQCGRLTVLEAIESSCDGGDVLSKLVVDRVREVGEEIVTELSERPGVLV